MPSPFPGMDPWLENPSLFPNLHQRLITYAGDALQARLGERYFVSIGERVYIEHPRRAADSLYPDVHIVEREAGARTGAQATLEVDSPRVLMLEGIERREVFLEIQDATTGGEIVTVIEVPSPSNKVPGGGRDLYLRKQQRVLESTSSLVEIDLLRAGEPTVAVPAAELGPDPYRVVVSPASNRVRREIYDVPLASRLPRVAIPLGEGEPPVALDLQAILTEAYDNGAYRLKVDYGKAPIPPLDEAGQALARGVLEGSGRA